jgi:hypothetical protein
MKNITRMLAVGLLILGDLGLSQAQMAPTRGWPTHDYWTAGLFRGTGGRTYLLRHPCQGRRRYDGFRLVAKPVHDSGGIIFDELNKLTANQVARAQPWPAGVNKVALENIATCFWSR